MTDVSNVVVDVVALAGGRIVGRTRLQKMVYLLEQKGLESGATFYYYNFGPFSDDVADSVIDAKIKGEIKEKVDYRISDWSPYSVFSTDKESGEVDKLGRLPSEAVRGIVGKLLNVTSTVLELAATIHWIVFVENVADWRAELVRRKGAKAQDGKIESAVALLGELNLAPEV